MIQQQSTQQQQEEQMKTTLDTLSSMCRQERAGYKTEDYLHQQQQHPASPCGPLHTATTSSPMDIDVDCRTKMVAWCYQVVDFCKFRRETVEIAMNLLDRYMMTSLATTAKLDRKLYQLAAMTCLYTAVKIHEPEAMDPALVSNLSRGTYSAAEVEAMELQILTALTWRVNPPTALSFVRHYLDVMTSMVTLDSYTMETIYDLTKFQTELAVSEFTFLTLAPSVVAYCSLRNALESVGLDETTLTTLFQTLARAIGLPDDKGHVAEIQNGLYQAIVHEPAARAIFRTEKATTTTTTCAHHQLTRQSSHEVSPRSVSA
eukprot:CAMPEP_0172446740 /NCGR_PEP_ID=MMETSP1065-20121228/6270_1 /TAXON_ID=265537 /ORGANISM="Amphiprora paludosa, Strain CCMP125" /LENGTH=316 /DNA_ID=CAMNT_0013197929 /DNA_START=63 /DNA_END=1013 /DNA_ORIENTATION=+